MLALVVVAALQGDLDRFKGETPRPTLCAQARVDRKARGAYFRKVESAPGPWYGLAAAGTLPKVFLDPERWFDAAPGQPAHWTGPLDRPDVYVGAHGENFALDTGLIWDRGHFRPYWRVTTPAGSKWGNPPVDDSNVFQPGEPFVLTLRRHETGFRLDIRSGSRHLVQLIEAEPPARLSFKRVSSIDQFRVVEGERKGNEGQGVIPTRTRAVGGAWWRVHLLGPRGRSPLAGGGCTEVVGLDDSGARLIASNAEGGERLDLAP